MIRWLRGDGCVAEAHRLHHAGTKVVNHHVGLVGETKHHVETGRLPEDRFARSPWEVGAREEVAVLCNIAPISACAPQVLTYERIQKNA